MVQTSNTESRGTIIIGMGEIGSSLGRVLDAYRPVFCDPKFDSTPIGHFEYMHVCFPYSGSFVEAVKAYQSLYRPRYTIIHSTVPVGTSRGLNVIFSPVVGLHPHLDKSLKTFTKYLAGTDASSVADYFRRVGMRVYLLDKQETAELAKLSQTSFYALMIEYVKELKKHCDTLGLSYTEVYTLFSEDYNNGYERLGYPEFKMPLLIPIQKKQGGHCTIPNLELWHTPFTDFIKQQNESSEPPHN